MRLGSRSVLGRVSPLDMKREAVHVCACSVRCSVETDGRIELAFGTDDFLNLSCTAF